MSLIVLGPDPGHFKGPKYAEPGRPPSAKVLRQPVNLKPDGSSQSSLLRSSVKQGSNIEIHTLELRESDLMLSLALMLSGYSMTQVLNKDLAHIVFSAQLISLSDLRTQISKPKTSNSLLNAIFSRLLNCTFKPLTL